MEKTAKREMIGFEGKVLLDGFDPFAHWALDDVAAVPGWRSNEPGALERGGETFDQLKMIRPDVRVILSSGYSLTGQAADDGAVG